MGRPSTVDLLIKRGDFVKRDKYSFSMKSSLSKLVSTRRSTVLILPLQKGFPDYCNGAETGWVFLQVSYDFSRGRGALSQEKS